MLSWRRLVPICSSKLTIGLTNSLLQHAFRFNDCFRSASAEEARRVQLETRLLAVGNDIARLKQEITNGQKALEEEAAVFEAIKIKHQQNVYIPFYSYLVFYLKIIHNLFPFIFLVEGCRNKIYARI